MNTIFNKIFVNNQEIQESDLIGGKYQLPAGETTAIVKFQLKDPTTVPDVFYNNSQIKRIVLGETITTIPNNAFYGTDIPEADMHSITALQPNAFEPKNQEPEPQEPEFTSTTYYFISYGDANGENEYANGQVETIDDIKIFDSVEYQGVNVIVNSDNTFVIENPYYINASAQADNNILYQLYNEEGTELGIYVKIYTNIINPEEPQNLGLYYIGTTLPTDENIDNLEKEELQDWNSENYHEFSLDIDSLTTCYVMLPKNLEKTIHIIDPNNLPQQGQKLESITDYDIYEYEFNNMVYKLYFG